jgi:hypothetical protein
MPELLAGKIISTKPLQLDDSAALPPNSAEPNTKRPHPPANLHRHYLPPLVFPVLGCRTLLSLGMPFWVHGCNNLLCPLSTVPLLFQAHPNTLVDFNKFLGTNQVT